MFENWSVRIPYIFLIKTPCFMCWKYFLFVIFFGLCWHFFPPVYHEMSPVLQNWFELNYFTVETGLVTFICWDMSGGRATERIWGVTAGVWGLNSVAHLTFPDIPTLIVEIIHFLSRHPYFSFENSHKTESGYIGLCLFRCFLNWLWAVRWLAAVRKYPGTHLNYDGFSVCFRLGSLGLKPLSFLLWLHFLERLQEWNTLYHLLFCFQDYPLLTPSALTTVSLSMVCNLQTHFQKTVSLPRVLWFQGRETNSRVL